MSAIAFKESSCQLSLFFLVTIEVSMVTKMESCYRLRFCFSENLVLLRRLLL